MFNLLKKTINKSIYNRLRNNTINKTSYRTINILSINPENKYLFNKGSIGFLNEFINSNIETHNNLLINRKTNNNQFSFREDTKWIRDDKSWYGSSIPEDLQKRHVEITGPTSDTKMMINALNSNADCYMTDIEDSLAPNWNNIQNAHHNIYQAIRGNLTYNKLDNKGKTYEVESETPTLLVRTRGLHLKEENILDDNGNAVPAMLVDMGLHMYHNSKILGNNNGFTTGGLYFYIPKIETYEEALYINKLFTDLQEMTNLPVGTIKATLLIETYPAIFQTDEIIYALKDHIVGLNCGRWDYIFSLIKKNLHNKDLILPDRELLSMDRNFLKAYVKQIVKSCHNRNIHAMGGMSAFIPQKNPEINKKIMDKVIDDKILEINEGCDGAWVAHPGLIDPIKDLFNKALEFKDNQIDSDKNKDISLTNENFSDLSNTPTNYDNYTEDGMRNNISISLQYLAGWLSGNGAVALNGLMEDMATAEISLYQLKQWLHNNIFIKYNKDNYIEYESYIKLDRKLLSQILEEEYIKLSTTDALQVPYAKDKLLAAKTIIYDYITNENIHFLPDIANDVLQQKNNFSGIKFSKKSINRLSGCKQLSGLDLTKHRGEFFNDFIFNSSDENPFYQFLGTTTGISAVNVVAGGKGRVGPYVGGWQINAMDNRLNESMPDTLHVSPEEPGYSAIEINNHLEKADQIQHINKLNNSDYPKDVNYHDLALLADLEQGWSNPEKVRMAVKRSIMNGINLIHIEDQGIYKRCGHLGDKELAPLNEYKMILKSANLAAQELLGPQQSDQQWVRFVARTDALSAKRIMYSKLIEDENHPDHKFIDWQRGYSPDGKYLYLKEGINPETGNPWGLDLSITRCTEVVKEGLASHVWMETPDADLRVARDFIQGVNKNLEIYDKKAYGLYNHSPSFDWDVKFYEDALPMANNIIDFVRESVHNTNHDINTKISIVRNWLNNFGDKVQGDDTFSDNSIKILILASHDHINGTDFNNKMLNDMNNVLNDFSDSYYLEQCNNLLNNYKINDRKPIDVICDEIVSERLKRFEPILASFGFNAHLITLPEYHVIAHNMYNLSDEFKDNGIYAYVNQVQRPERLTYENTDNYTYYKHQTATGTGLEAEFNTLVGSSNSNILSGSTETDDDKKRNN